MTDNPADPQHNAPGEDSCHLARESQAMRSVVRNMVANMEHVLNDLQGIMGDIQSLVVQIDTVTDHIDKQCGTHADSSENPNMSQYCVRRPHFVHGSQQCTGSVHNALYSHVDSENSSVAENNPSTSNFPSHSVVCVKAFRRDTPAEASTSPEYEQPRSKSEVSISTNHMKDVRMPCSSRSFSHFSKEGGSTISPSGGIAIVYPTIKSTPVASSDIELKNESSNVTKTSLGSLHLQNNSTVKRMSLINKPLQIFSKLLFQDNETKENKQAAAKHRHGVTSVYNMSFQPVTPTEQRSPVISAGHRNPHAQASEYEIMKAFPSSRAAMQDSRPHRVSCPTPEKTYKSYSPNHKYCTIGGSLSKSLQTHYESPAQAQHALPSSPLMKRSSARAVYSKVLGSPASSRRSPGTFRRLARENYYFSIESDLDSEALIENIDTRSMTPDIDWSYLNLVGNDQFRGNQTRIFETPSSDHGYEIPIVPSKVHQQFQMLQTSPDVVDRLPIIKIQSVPTSEAYSVGDSNVLLHIHNVVDEMNTNPVMAHIFCSEVGSFNTSGYCGWYEFIMDSVLENIAGFESFEEACEDFDNYEALNETYISFEDQFEEDDWDIGMRSEDQCGFGLHPFDFQTLYGFGGYFGRLQAMDDNSNIFSASNKLVSVTGTAPSIINSRQNSLLERAIDGCNDIDSEKCNQQRLSPTFTDTDIFEDLSFAEETGNSFTDDDCCAIKPSVPDQHQNFILWQKSFIPRDLRLLSEASKSASATEAETEMSSSDDTSCQAVGTGSPMSFSSPEAVLTSPDTDRFVTSSEGDDLFTSQEEAYFHFSEAQDNANVSAARATMLQLRREFFESLYNVCERREKEMSQDSEPKIPAEESSRCDPSFSRIDNNRDNVSETGSYQEDSTSYNKSINTWTAYAMVHLQADDLSDSTSDIFNDNNISCSMTSSYLDADNIGSAPENQGLIC